MISFLVLVALAPFLSPNILAQETNFEPIYHSESFSLDVAVEGNYAYVTSGRNGVNIFDISDKSNISLIGNFYEEGCSFSTIEVVGNIGFSTQSSRFCSDRRSLHIIDASDPTNPTKISSLKLPISPREITVKDNFAYIMGSGGMQIVDISDLSNPQKLGFYDPVPPKPTLWHVGFSGGDLVGNKLYLSDIEGPRVWIVDVSDKHNPTTISYSDTWGNNHGIDIMGNHAYIASYHFLSIYDISDVNNLREISSVPKGPNNSAVLDVKVANENLVFIGDKSGGVAAINITDPENPVEIDRYIPGGRVQKLDVENGYVYLADVDTGFYVLRYHGLKKSVQPFLELPWNYESLGLTFSEAALAMTSYFDHEYPLLSIGSWREPDDANWIVNYNGYPKINRKYSSHDGYDWGRLAGTTHLVPQLATASGTATYHYGSAKGSAIYVDHNNGYQTRHYHLDDEGLITNTFGEQVEVTQGQQIGLTGLTGNTTGAHVHFMVIEDKNGDGNFNDNIPDGLVDPFGWQSDEPDPWPNYTFEYKDVQKTGNTSSYLWLHDLIINGKNAITGGEIVEIEGNSIEFPENASEEPFNVRLEYAQYFNSDSLASIGPTLKATATNLAGELIDIFDKPFKLQMKITDAFLDNINVDTLAIFSSNDGQIWAQEDTDIDWDSGTATAYFGHFSYFALMGEPIDTSAPTTTLTATGDEGESGWFRSDIEVSLSVSDESSVQYIAVKINDEEWEEYTSPTLLVEEGSYTIQYYSEDEFGNLEEIQTKEINIDKQAPELSIHFDISMKSFKYETLDNNHAEVVVTEDEGNKVDIQALDKAGNSTLLSGQLVRNNNGERLIFRTITSKEVSKEYEEAWLNASYKIKRDKPIEFTQVYKHLDHMVRIQYDHEDDKSVVSEKEFEDEWTGSTIDGMIILTIQTKKGDLEFSY